jgi:ankyrin repeat protein
MDLLLLTNLQAPMVLELMKGGADPSRHDREGRTALSEACRSGGSRVVEVLVAAGAK